MPVVLEEKRPVLGRHELAAGWLRIWVDLGRAPRTIDAYAPGFGRVSAGVWQAVRPEQPKMLDRKTGDHVDFLFAYRARRVAKHYINNAIIPMLCSKAGVPDADVRGNITSHRARSTIASQLYNAKEPRP